MLSVKNLEVVYQDVILVLRGISFEIPKGKIYGSEGIDPIVGFCIMDLITNMNRKDVVIKPRIIDFNVFVLPKRNRSLKDDAKHSLLL